MVTLVTKEMVKLRPTCIMQSSNHEIVRCFLVLGIADGIGVALPQRGRTERGSTPAAPTQFAHRRPWAAAKKNETVSRARADKEEEPDWFSSTARLELRSADEGAFLFGLGWHARPRLAASAER